MVRQEVHERLIGVGALPRLPRNTEHRAFAGPGITDDNAQIPAIARMVERGALLA